MTRQRNDDKSTELGLWLRGQLSGQKTNVECINSKPTRKHRDAHYRATNIDYMWQNYHNGLWMLIEEKRYGTQLIFPQSAMIQHFDSICAVGSSNYRGFHLIIFENTNPEDGRIFLDEQRIAVDDLLEFLRFEKGDDWYVSYFEKKYRKKPHFSR